VDVEGFHREHAEIEQTCADLLRTARRLPELDPPSRLDAYAQLLDALEPLDAHMLLDERLLFQAVCRRLGDPLATAAMSYDHLAIRDWLRRLREADPEDVPALQELLYGLAALIRVHVWKERELYLAMLESGSWPTAV
jgi:hemerythrin-like domain-containing protein